MELIARIALRLHEIGDASDGETADKHEKSVVIFRIVGRSADEALKALDSEVSLSYRPLVALAVPPKAMTKAQEKVYEAVISACRRRSSKVYACGGDSEKLLRQVASGAGPDKWFPSVSEMVQDFGDAGSRYDARR